MYVVFRTGGQLSNKPTQRSAEAMPSLAATNAADLQVTILAPLGKLDHAVLKGNFPALTMPTIKRACKRLAWCWNRANIAGLKQAIASEK